MLLLLKIQVCTHVIWPEAEMPQLGSLQVSRSTSLLHRFMDGAMGFSAKSIKGGGTSACLVAFLK